jgi:hypothetical protein
MRHSCEQTGRQCNGENVFHMIGAAGSKLERARKLSSESELIAYEDYWLFTWLSLES